MKRHEFLLLILTGIALSVLLFRPHEDTFTALDHSGYRLMGLSLAEGREFHEQDRVLSQLPQPLRRHVLLLPHMKERNTRDRSFELLSLKRANTEPFFYPLLPLIAAQAERMWPGQGLDLVMPFCGLLFFAVLIGVGYTYGKLYGAAFAVALGIGTPLPVFLYRGFYVEGAGLTCVVIGCGLWLWMGTRSQSLFAGVAALCWGLAVSFHPVFVVIALPLLVVVSLSPGVRLRDMILMGVTFLLGLAPLIWMTRWICTPYGNLGISSLMMNFSTSSSHRLTLLMPIVSVGLFIPLWATRKWWIGRVNGLYASVLFRIVCFVLSFIPLAAALWFWRDGSYVQAGLRECFQAVRWPLGMVLAAGMVCTVVKGSQPRAYCLLLVALVVMPVFFYLKGAEQMGMWSQRRLLPFYGLMAMSLIPASAWELNRFRINNLNPNTTRGFLTALFLIAAGVSAVRWPAPYVTRVEQGATEWVDEIKETYSEGWLLFDYAPYSFPFAVDNRTSAVSISHPRNGGMTKMADWALEQSEKGIVHWFSAYENPGLEKGVRLVTTDTLSVDLPRINSKSSLPAEAYSRRFQMDVLKSVPLGAETESAELFKILDGGPLALRGKWGGYRRSITNEQGERLPADWTRTGAGVIGPVADKGSQMVMELIAVSGQAEAQRLQISPPWSENPEEILVQPGYGSYTIEFVRGAEDEVEGGTGVYRFHCPEPYNPADDGIQGFPSDLGVLVHSIRIGQ